jgi:hypothetical protein
LAACRFVVDILFSLLLGNISSDEIVISLHGSSGLELTKYVTPPVITPSADMKGTTSLNSPATINIGNLPAI